MLSSIPWFLNLNLDAMSATFTSIIVLLVILVSDANQQVLDYKHQVDGNQIFMVTGLEISIIRMFLSRRVK